MPTPFPIPVKHSTPQNPAPGSFKEQMDPEVKSQIADTSDKGASSVTEGQQPLYELPGTVQYKPKSRPEDKVTKQTPKDHVATMWKVQLTPFSVKPGRLPVLQGAGP